MLLLKLFKNLDLYPYSMSFIRQRGMVFKQVCMRDSVPKSLNLKQTTAVWGNFEVLSVGLFFRCSLYYSNFCHNIIKKNKLNDKDISQHEYYG